MFMRDTDRMMAVTKLLKNYDFAAEVWRFGLGINFVCLVLQTGINKCNFNELAVESDGQTTVPV